MAHCAEQLRSDNHCSHVRSLYRCHSELPSSLIFVIQNISHLHDLPQQKDNKIGCQRWPYLQVFINSWILTLCSEWLTAPSSSGRIIIAHTSVLSTERKFHHLGFRCLWQVMYQRHSSSLLYTMGCKLFLKKYFLLLIILHLPHSRTQEPLCVKSRT